MQTWVRSPGWEDLLEKGKATHSSILGWRFPWAGFADLTGSSYHQRFAVRRYFPFGKLSDCCSFHIFNSPFYILNIAWLYIFSNEKVLKTHIFLNESVLAMASIRINICLNSFLFPAFCPIFTLFHCLFIVFVKLRREEFFNSFGSNILFINLSQISIKPE